jgi:F0F1-type ATP synthase assembly protein I
MGDFNYRAAQRDAAAFIASGCLLGAVLGYMWDCWHNRRGS